VKVLELFSGTESFSEVARERVRETFTIDNNPVHKPDWCTDIIDVTVKDILRRFGRPDTIKACERALLRIL